MTCLFAGRLLFFRSESLERFTMRLTSKHAIIMAIWLITSLALVIFVPTTKYAVEETASSIHQSQSNNVSQQRDVRLEESYVATIIVILAKGAIAIILGIFALFCICSRFGTCYAKRNKAILASTCHPRSSADA